MKKSLEFGASLLLIVVYANLVLADVRINEIECNPLGADAKNEWVELYSESEVDLNGWRIENSEGKTVELEGQFKGYFIINFSTQWLDNTQESLDIYDGEKLIDSADSFDDSDNDNRTWQYCDSDWSYLDSSKGKENDCEEEENEEEEEKDTSSLKLEWEEKDIQNTKEFEVDIKALDLLDKDYDIQIYIYDDEDNVISERYSQETKEWKAGSYFLTKILEGPGDVTETVKIRLKESYSDFKGEGDIIVKLRPSGTFSIIAEKSYPIEILKEDGSAKKDETEEETSQDEEETSQEEEDNDDNEVNKEITKTTAKVIKLGNRNITRETAKKTVNENEELEPKEEKILYESSSEIMKKYAIYGLNLVLIGIIIFLLINFKKKKNQD